MAERATAAFVLALIAAILHLIIGIGLATIAAFAATLGILGGLGLGGLAVSIAFLAWTVAVIVLAFVGAFWLYSGDKTRTTYGGILTLLVAFLALPTLWGFGLGFLLGLIGGILGLVWSPIPAVAPGVPAAPVPPPMPAEPVAQAEEAPPEHAEEPRQE